MLIEDLRSLLIKNKFFKIDEVTNEIDGLNGKLVLNKNASIDEKIKAINLCCLIGFECSAIDLPIVKFIEDDKDVNEYDIFIKDMENDFMDIESIENIVEQKADIYNYEDLSCINDIKKGLLIDTDNDFLPDYINSQIVVSKNPSDNEVLAACNISTILGFNSVGCNLNIALTEENLDSDNDKLKIYIGKKFLEGNVKFNDSNIIFKKENKSLIIGSEEEDIIKTSEIFCKSYEYFIKPNEVSLKDFKEDLKSLLKKENKSSNIKVFEKEFNFKWEVDEVKSILNDKLINKIKKDD